MRAQWFIVLSATLVIGFCMPRNAIGGVVHLLVVEPLLTEGTILPNYAIVSVGPGASLNMGGAQPVNGAVLIGDGSTATSSGGGNTSIMGGVSISPPCTSCILTNIAIPPSVTIVSSSVGATAFADAATLAAEALALTPVINLGNIGNTTTNIVGAGGINAFSIASGNNTNPRINISGGPDDLFVFNVAGNISTNVP
jgi:hypothetical protein